MTSIGITEFTVLRTLGSCTPFRTDEALEGCATVQYAQPQLIVLGKVRGTPGHGERAEVLVVCAQNSYWSQFEES